MSGIEEWLNSRWFWLRVCQEVVSKVLIEGHSSEGLLVLEDTLPKWLPNGWNVGGAGWWEASTPFHEGLSIDCLRSS